MSEATIGILLCIVGSAGTNLGLTVQKYSFTCENNNGCTIGDVDVDSDVEVGEEGNKEYDRSENVGWTSRYASTIWWCVGFTIFLCGQVLNLLAMSFSTQAIVATLGSFSLVTNVIFAPCILHERVNKYQIISIAIIITGCIAVVLSSTVATQDYTLSTLITLYQQPMFIVYAVLSTVVLALSLYVIHRGDDRGRGLFTSPPLTQDMLDEIIIQKSNSNSSNSNNNANTSMSSSQSTPAGLNLNDSSASSHVTTPPTIVEEKEDLNDNSDVASDATTEDAEYAPSSDAEADDNTHKELQSNNEESNGIKTKQLTVQPYSLPEVSDTTSHASRGSYHDIDESGSSDDEYRDDQLPVNPTIALWACVAAAVFSSFSVLFAKCVMQLVKHTFQYHDNQFLSLWSYLVTATFLTCAIMSIVYLNAALRVGLALTIVPFYYVLSTALAIIGGLMYFKEYENWTWKSGTVFAAGVTLTIVGVWVATKGTVEQQVTSATEDERLHRLAEEQQPLLQKQATDVPPSPAATGITLPSPTKHPHARTPSLHLDTLPSPMYALAPPLPFVHNASISSGHAEAQRRMIRALSEPPSDLQPLQHYRRRSLTPPGRESCEAHRLFNNNITPTSTAKQQHAPRLKQRAMSVGYGTMRYEQAKQSFWSGFKLSELMYQYPLSYRLLLQKQHHPHTPMYRQSTLHRRVSTPIIGINIF